MPHYAGAGIRNGHAYFHWNPATTFISSIEVQITAMQAGDMSQHVLDSLAVPGLLRNQMYSNVSVHQCLSPCPTQCLFVTTAIATPGDGGAFSYVQYGVAPATGQILVSNAKQPQPQRFDCPRVAAKLRELWTSQSRSVRRTSLSSLEL
eukprot:6209779-Pleurochrysis_carterae.AAC.2